MDLNENWTSIYKFYDKYFFLSSDILQKAKGKFDYSRQNASNLVKIFNNRVATCQENQGNASSCQGKCKLI